MQDAASLLRTDVAVKSIALELDYLEPAHFCREFRRFFGRSPEQIRAEMQMSLLDHQCPFQIIEEIFKVNRSGVSQATVRRGSAWERIAVGLEIA
jgi:AraC-like DNA-binding protein